jgi:phospholipid transport system substrate-binding protein
MKSRVALAVALALSLTVSIAHVTCAGEPTEQLKSDIPRVFKALDEPARREAIREVSRDLFDWPEMSRQVLGRYWPARTQVEREKFTELLAALVDAQIATLAGHGAAAIVWVDESIDGHRASVRTRVSTQPGRDFAIDYRLVRRGLRWLISDVLLDGASLVGTYRAQFQRILKTSSYEQLVEKLDK